jgi:hypothetical protein
MKYGITMFPTDYSIRPGELAAAVEQRGFESFWVPEHSHLPVSDMTPGRDTPGLPNMYYDVVDPFVAGFESANAGAIIPELVKVFTSTESAHVREVVTASSAGGQSRTAGDSSAGNTQTRGDHVVEPPPYACLTRSQAN